MDHKADLTAVSGVFFVMETGGVCRRADRLANGL